LDRRPVVLRLYIVHTTEAEDYIEPTWIGVLAGWEGEGNELYTDKKENKFFSRI
jgi:hypothetical protein